MKVLLGFPWLFAMSAMSVLLFVSTWVARVHVQNHTVLVEEHLHSVKEDVRRLLLLRGSASAMTVGPQPSADLVTRCQRALLDAGLPITACSGVQPKGDVVLSSDTRVQSEQIILQHLTPEQFGAWWTAWSRVPMSWRLVSLQLVHAEEGTSASDPAGHFTCIVDLAAPYMTTQP